MLEGAVVYVVGLPSSGKTTLAENVVASLQLEGRQAVLLDGDLVRGCIVPAHGYDVRGRSDFYETLARTAAMLAERGHVVVVAATAAKRIFRARARELTPRFVEVHMDVPLATCVARDAKKLYASRVPDLPGVDVAFEKPARPDVTVRSSGPASVARVVAAIASVTSASSSGPPD